MALGLKAWTLLCAVRVNVDRERLGAVKVYRHVADEKPLLVWLALTRPFLLDAQCTWALIPRPDFYGWKREGVATLLPVGFPNLARRDVDLGQGSLCHFWQLSFCADLDHLCLAFFMWSPC